MPSDYIQTGNGVTIKEAVRAYKQGYEARGSKIKVISATKTRIHFEIISHRGIKIAKTHRLQKADYTSPAFKKFRKVATKKHFDGIFQD